MLKIFSVPALLGCVWCIKNIIVSGYPIFPTTLFAFPVDWLMPAELVEVNRKAVMGWARWPRDGFLEALESGITYWFPSWFSNFISSATIWCLLILPLFAAIALWIVVLYKNRCSFKILFIFSYSIISLVYWFFMYPDPRFGAEFAWTLLASGAALFITLENNIFQKIVNVVDKELKYIPCACVCVFFLGTIFLNLHTLPKLTWHAKAWPALPVVQTIVAKEFPQESFVLWTPENDDRCGIAPLPCADHKNEQLRMRKQNNLLHGFYIKQIEPQ